MARILIVDDDEQVRTLTAKVLTRAGHEVVTHHSGFGLALAVKEHQPRLLILDVHMPGLRGDAAVRVLDGLPAIDPPTVLLFSGMDPMELQALGKRLGAEVLSKPPRPSELLAMVRYCLSIHRKKTG